MGPQHEEGLASVSALCAASLYAGCVAEPLRSAGGRIGDSLDGGGEQDAQAGATGERRGRVGCQC